MSRTAFEVPTLGDAQPDGVRPQSILRFSVRSPLSGRSAWGRRLSSARRSQCLDRHGPNPLVERVGLQNGSVTQRKSG